MPAARWGALAWRRGPVCDVYTRAGALGDPTMTLKIFYHGNLGISAYTSGVKLLYSHKLSYEPRKSHGPTEQAGVRRKGCSSCFCKTGTHHLYNTRVYCVLSATRRKALAGVAWRRAWAGPSTRFVRVVYAPHAGNPNRVRVVYARAVCACAGAAECLH